MMPSARNVISMMEFVVLVSLCSSGMRSVVAM